MSAPPLALPASISTSGYQDGLGRRSLAFDRESGSVLERLVVRPELVAFERSLRERADHLASFDDERIARVRDIEHDRDARTLTVVSEFVGGRRLSDLLDEILLGPIDDENAAPSIDQALGLLLQLLPALSALHTGARVTHGVLGAGRIAVTPAGEIVLLDSIYGPSIERLQLSRRRLWAELRVAPAPSAGACRFDVTADIAQAALAAAAITVGRPLGDRDYPDGLRTLLSDMTEIAQLRGSARFATALQRFFERALPLPASRVYASADEASNAIQELVTAEMGASRCRAALASLVRDTPAAVEREVSIPHVVIRSEPIAVHAQPAVLPPIVSEPEPIAIEPEPVVMEPEPVALAVEPAAIEAEAATPAPEPIALAPLPVEIPSEPVIEVLPEPTPTEEQPLAIVPEALVAAVEPVAETSAMPATDPVADLQPDCDRDLPVFDSAFEAVPSLAPETVEVEAADVDEPPAPAPAVAPAAIAAPVPVVAPPATAASQKAGGKRKRSKRGRRDHVQPAAPKVPPPVAVAAPAPPVRSDAPLQMPQMPVLPPAPRMPVYEPPAQAVWAAPLPVPLAPIAAAPVIAPVAPPPATPVRVKLAAPTGYVPRPHPGDFNDISAHHAVISYPESRPAGTFKWKFVAAAAIVVAIGVTVGRASLLDRSPAPSAAASPKTDPVVVATDDAPSGSIAIETQPDGARVLIDGKPAGESPLKVDGIAPGSHIVTLITSSATLKRSVKVEAGKTSSVDVPVYSGWLALFSPVVLEVGENGRSLGTTEHGRLMLPPGRHTLTFANKELGYSLVKKVDIESGEERALTLDPRGTISLNAVPWAEVYIDGQRAGETPIANLQVPLGTREILFKHPQLGERRVTEIVKATGPSAVSVDFTK